MLRWSHLLPLYTSARSEMDGRLGLPLIAPSNPGQLLRQSKLPGQEKKAKKEKALPWVAEAFSRANAPADTEEHCHVSSRSISSSL